MIDLTPIAAELPRRVPSTRICEGCGASLQTQPHDPRCPSVVRVRRLATTPEERRLEDLLEKCNVAGQLWLRERDRRAA